MLERFSTSLETELLASFDRYIEEHGYTNRSEAIRDLLRKALFEEEWRKGTVTVMGVISLVYDHHQRNLLSKITDIQHEHHADIISSTHIHMDHHNCLEVIVVRGQPSDVSSLANRLVALKGVKHGSVSVMSAGES